MNPLTAELDVGGVWHLSLFFGLALCVVAWVKTFKNLAWEAKALWAYVLISALYVLEFPARGFGTYHTAFQASAGQTFAEALLIPLGALFATKWIGKLLFFVALVELICIWLNIPGLLIAPSFDLAFLALCFPFTYGIIGWSIFFTILTHHGGTACVILATQFLTFGIQKKRFRELIIVLPLLAGAAYFHSRGALLDGAERLERYQKYMTFWATQDLKTLVLGVGSGSFMWCSCLLDKWRGDLFLAMHSDWLQIIFETGLVGLGLVGAVFYRAVKNVWNDPVYLPSIFGVAAFALTYHPLRFFPTAFLTALIFSTALITTSSSKARS